EMAFNPFHVVRKRQKTLLAITTIFIMFLFTLQFGPGDIFARLGLSGKRRQEVVVTKMYGNKVLGIQVDEIRVQRKFVREFLSNASLTAFSRVQKELEELGKDVKPGDEDFGRRMQLQSEYQRLMFLPQFLAYSAASLDQLDRVLDFIMWRHQA